MTPAGEGAAELADLGRTRLVLEVGAEAGDDGLPASDHRAPPSISAASAAAQHSPLGPSSGHPSTARASSIQMATVDPGDGALWDPDQCFTAE